MALFGWHNCPAASRAQVDELTAALSGFVADQLLGIYLHGSLALGSFNPRHSDLDLLVITSARLPLATKRQIVEFLLECSRRPHPIEISLLARAQLLPWRYPPPFDLHYSEAWRARYADALATGAWQAWNDAEHQDPDLAAHITVLNARGIRLAGASIAAQFPAVPADHYRASLAADIADGLDAIAANPVYAILNCCRTYAYLHDRQVRSKEEGGRWALDALPAGLRDPVIRALAAYCSDADLPQFDPNALRAFAAYMRQALLPALQPGEPA
jgi:streptomycin 3"-adenylyltransferase